MTRPCLACREPNDTDGLQCSRCQAGDRVRSPRPDAPKELEQTEAEIRLEIKRWYRTAGAEVWDTEQERAARVDPGLADLIVVWPGRGIRFVEVKRRNGRQSPDQKRFQRAVEAAGGTYLLAFSLDQVMRFEG